jgi:hypothetical protein
VAELWQPDNVPAFLVLVKSSLRLARSWRIASVLLRRNFEGCSMGIRWIFDGLRGFSHFPSSLCFNLRPPPLALALGGKPR